MYTPAAQVAYRIRPLAGVTLSPYIHELSPCQYILEARALIDREAWLSSVS